MIIACHELWALDFPVPPAECLLAGDPGPTRRRQEGRVHGCKRTSPARRALAVSEISKLRGIHSCCLCLMYRDYDIAATTPLGVCSPEPRSQDVWADEQTSSKASAVIWSCVSAQGNRRIGKDHWRPFHDRRSGTAGGLVGWLCAGGRWRRRRGATRTVTPSARRGAAAIK